MLCREHILDGIPLLTDDIVLLSENEIDLQELLRVLNGWCLHWRLCVNVAKSKVIHFRPLSKPLTEHNFTCGSNKLEIVKQYKYLGLILTENLDFGVGVDTVVQAANRSLELLSPNLKHLEDYLTQLIANYMTV